MRFLFLFLGINIFCSLFIKAQSTWDDVYTILNTNCGDSGCHYGTPNFDFSLTSNEVYNNLYNIAPQNETAANKGNKYIFPGDPYRSYLFRKINRGFTPDVPIETNEIDAMDIVPIDGVSIEDKELIRQWILKGAPETGEVVDQNIIAEYYNGNGINSIESPPAAPAPDEGFQIHLGPFFIAPGSEQEFFYKYRMQNQDKVEVTNFETTMGESSHHFIIMKFADTFGDFTNTTDEGLRIWDRHDHAEFVEVAQGNQTTQLPNGSAFFWEDSAILDLNTHYINFSQTSVLACDIYVNINTQAEGTANQIMYAQLIPNLDLAIPPNVTNYTVTDTFSVPFPNLYVWSLTSHAHSTSIDYDIFQPFADQEPLHIYDASCPNGVPGCDYPFYDYENPPTRFFEPFLYTDPTIGVIHSVAYNNPTNLPVQWTWTSDGEMMVFVMRYLFDTVGVSFEEPVGLEIINTTDVNISVFPNPADKFVILNWEKGLLINEILIFDQLGRNCNLSKNNMSLVGEEQARIELNNLISGIYLIQLNDKYGNAYFEKIVIK